MRTLAMVFLCTLCVLENSSPRHGRKRNKNPGPERLFLVALRKVLKAVKDLWVSESTAVSLLTKIWLLTHWPIEIGRKSKTAQLWKESLYAPLWPECLYAYPVGKKSMPARQIDKFAPLHTLKSVIVNPKTDCQFEKMVFLRSLNISVVS